VVSSAGEEIWMEIVLKPELQRYVEQQVRSGKYAAVEDVVAAALVRQMQDERLDQFLPGELDELLAAGEADLERGDVVTLEEAREHFRRRSDAKKDTR
jgi:antitoxin ParD1/3/4